MPGDRIMRKYNVQIYCVLVQISPVSSATKAVREYRGNAPYELVFIATAPPLGYNTYFVRYSKLGSCDPLCDCMIKFMIT